MKQVKRKLYRLRSKVIPKWYIGARAGSWGQLVSKNKGMKRTRYWWGKNLSPGWSRFYQLELVGNGRRMGSR